METARMRAIILLLFLIGLNLERCAAVDRSRSPEEQKLRLVNIGVVVDMGSWTGKNVRNCITMAISDFYASHAHYKTRLVMRTRDSRGDPGRAISSVLHLLKHMKMQALLVLGQETKSLGVIGNEAKVPIFSFASTFLSSPAEYPFLIQINQDQVSEFKGIASIVSQHKWRTIAVLYEDSDDDGGNDSIPFLVGSLEARNIRVTHLIAISPDDDNILEEELHKLAVAQQTIFVVHMSPLFSSRLFFIAKRNGLMEKGYAWIVTSKTMNQIQLQSMDGKVVESMQGVVGFRAHIPSTRNLRDFSLRWRNKFYRNNPYSREVDILGIRAYDTIWALAESIEKLGQTNYRGSQLVEEISGARFKGLSGKFEILDGRLHSQVFTIDNFIGKQGRRVGFWTPKDGIVQKIPQYSIAGRRRSLSRSTMATLEAIIWPGVTTIAPNPKGLFMLLTSSKKLRIAVPFNQGFKKFVDFAGDFLTNKTSFKGFSIDVFQAAINSLDYQVPFEFIAYNGSYNDLVYQVYQQEYDGIVGDLTITAQRSSYVDFTVSYTDIGTGTITKLQVNDNIWLFSKPLRLDLWLASAALCVLTGVVVWFIEHSSSNQEFGGSVCYQIGTMLWFGFSTLFYAHKERLRSNLSRFVVIVWLFVVLILTSTYTATLSSMLTLQKIPFASPGDYIGSQFDGPLARGTIANSLDSKDDQLRLYSLPEEYADALSSGNVRAIVSEIPYLKIFLVMYGPRYAMVSTHPNSAGFGFAFQKKYAKLVSDLSRAIIKLREEGELASMEKTWFNSESLFIPEEDNAANTPNILNLCDFGGVFLVSISCCVFALLLRLASILRKKLKSIIMVIRDEGVLAYMSNKIASRGGQL